MSKICIIGGAGFVGSNLARHFSKHHNVLIVDNLVRRGSEINLQDLLQNYTVKFIHADIRNKEDFVSIRNWKPDIVLNCAAQPAATNYSNPEFDLTNNCTAQINVMEFCKEQETPVIFWSTNKVYPATFTERFLTEEKKNKLMWEQTCPSENYWSPVLGFNENTPISAPDHSIYGVSKAMADLVTQEYADAFNIPCIINRFSCLAGPNQWGKAEQGWVTWFAIAKVLQLPITFYGFNGCQVRDCLFTPDINKLIDKQIHMLLYNRSWNKVYNVGGGNTNTLSLKECVSILNEIEGTSWHQENIPIEGKRRADQGIYISNSEKVRSDFNWEPELSIREGLESIYQWVFDNKHTLAKIYK